MTGLPAGAPRVAGLVLAAGAGRRYGGPKALLVHAGRLLVERAAQTLRDGGCDPVVVVLGAAADRVRARADLPGCTVVDNPQWETGMGSSLRAGLRALTQLPPDDRQPVAVLVLLVDLPWVTAAAVRRVAGRAGPQALALAGYGGRRGHPVLLGRDHWAPAAALATGDTGARRYLAQHPELVQLVPCEDVADGRDVDIPGDWSPR